MSATPQQMAAKVHGVARAMPKANRAGTEAAALVVTTAVRAAATAKGVGPGQPLRGFLPRKVTINAGYNVKGYENATALVKARPAGVAAMVNNGTKPHVIAARRRPGVRTRRRGARALRLPNGFATSVQHPGSPGLRYWQDGVAVGAREAPLAWKRAHDTSIRREFTG